MGLAGPVEGLAHQVGVCVFLPQEVRGKAIGGPLNRCPGSSVSLEVGGEVVVIVLAGGKEGQAEGGFHFYSQVFIERLLCARPGMGEMGFEEVDRVRPWTLKSKMAHFRGGPEDEWWESSWKVGRSWLCGVGF